MDADDKHDTQPGNTEQHDEEVAHGATHFAAGKDNLNIAESAEKSCKCLVGGWRIDLDKAEGFGKIPKPSILAVIGVYLLQGSNGTRKKLIDRYRNHSLKGVAAAP